LCISCFAFIIIIIIVVVVVVVIVIVIIPIFVVLLNCLYLTPRVLLFVCSPPHRTAEGEEERVSGYMVLIAGCWVKPGQHAINN